MSRKHPTPSDRTVIFTRYITRGGRRIYHPRGGLFVFTVRNPRIKRD